MSSFAELILPLPLGNTFTYAVPLHLRQEAQVGMRVVVQFGQRKYYSGIIYRLHNQPPKGDFELKFLEGLLDYFPIVSEKQLELWAWISAYYCCSLGEVYRAALPSGLKLESETRFGLNPQFEHQSALSADENSIINRLEGEVLCNVHELNKVVSKKTSLPIIKQLLEKDALFIEETIEESYKPKTLVHLELSPRLHEEKALEEALQSLGRAKKQQQLLQVFLDAGLAQIEKKRLLEISGVSDAVLRALCEKELLQSVAVETDRLDLEEEENLHIHELSAAQQQALLNISRQQDKPVLLHGVTSSGKTELYIKLIQQNMERGKQSLFLVPEIGLTTQLIARLKKAFGKQAGIYHSRFNDGERVEIWNKTLQSQYKVVIGARSAVLLPFQNLGLIIVDEEHDQSYKQFDPAPRYLARDVAIVLAQLHGAKVLLGSATPSFESFFHAKTGKYALVELAERFGKVSLPQIVIADEKEAAKKKQMQAMLTPELHAAISQALAVKQQVILFQNRRGYAPYMQCSKCSWILKCKNCDVSLTYHKGLNFMNCHYCGMSKPIPSVCADCGSEAISTRGFGTEKVVEELAKLFPEANMARMDLDSTRSKFAYQRIIADFEEHRTDILIGTQMISKGLDFERVSVVGILSADQLINYPDYRAYERAYQVLTQVSGRAGRRSMQGLVVIQSQQPDHPVLEMVKAHHFTELFNQTLVERKLFRYPPYYRVLKIVLKHRLKETLSPAAKCLADRLRSRLGILVLGPEYPLVARVQAQYCKEIWVKLPRNNRIAEAKSFVLEEMARLKKERDNSGLTLYVDVDPY